MPDEIMRLLARPGGGRSDDDLLRALLVFALDRLGEARKPDDGPGVQPPVDASFMAPQIYVRGHVTPSVGA